ncbi:MAG: aminotransferase class I/II-fold pyridoxal phosphate-dependent enzyme [Hyphomicrobiaceae bacterium]
MNSDAPQNILARIVQSPFPRLRALLDGMEPGAPAIDMTVGEPRHAPPEFVARVIKEHEAEFAKYPPINGIHELRQSIARWLDQRYGLGGRLDAERNVHILCGSREGLFSAVAPALDRRSAHANPAVLIPNPFYQVYIAAALTCRAEPVFLPATVESGFLPDLDRLEADRALLERTRAFYLCSPSNPQGAVATPDYLRRAIGFARRHDFMLLADECYSEVYAEHPPPGALEIAAETGSFANVAVFNSLSKRSNLPGLRSGFVAGDGDFLSRLSQYRNVMAPQMPLPVQWASAAVWADEAHVGPSRRLYAEKFRLAQELLGNRFGNPIPGGGFFLWLDTSPFGGGEAAAVRLWKRCGVKVLPGAYLSQKDALGGDPGAAYVRVALVHDLKTTREALDRLRNALSE